MTDPGTPAGRSAGGATEDALFLDFDGTLVDIVAHPEAVEVDPSLGATLTRLHDRLGGALAIISGRAIAVLDRYLAPYRGDAAGLHGTEYRIGGRLFPCRPDDHPALRRGIERLRARLAGLTGVLVEDKGCSVAVHWRMAPALADDARDAAAALAAELAPRYRIQYGKAVAEILPASAGKGGAIERFLAEAPYAGRRPVFIGDDLTDEHGFETVNARGGLSVRVGAGPTVARQRVDTPAILRRRLAEWASGGRIGPG